MTGADAPQPPGKAQRIYLPRESAGSVRIEMMWCPSGPGNPDRGEHCRTLAYGSAFIYELDSNTYLVTARHNLTGRHWQTNACLGAYPVNPTHIRLGILAKPPEGVWKLAASEAGPHVAATSFLARIYLLRLLGEDWRPEWTQHHYYGADMDVAVLPISVSVPADNLLVVPWQPPIPASAPRGLKWPDLTAGQDVFVVGYPDALSTGPFLPLWVRGTIASEPGFGHNVNGQQLPLMLVDARTRRGQSGSVVMRHRPEGSFIQMVDGTPGIATLPQSQLIGVYSGRTSDESDLGYVWRIQEVDEICRQGVPGTTV